MTTLILVVSRTSNFGAGFIPMAKFNCHQTVTIVVMWVAEIAVMGDFFIRLEAEAVLFSSEYAGDGAV